MSRKRNNDDNAAISALEEVLANATVSLFLDMDSIDSSKLPDIMKGCFYDPMVDIEDVRESLFTEARDFGSIDNIAEGENPAKHVPLTPPQIKELAKTTHEKLKTYPADYDSYLLLPLDFPPTLVGPVTKNVEIVLADQALHDKYHPAPPTPASPKLPESLEQILRPDLAPKVGYPYLLVHDSGLVNNAFTPKIRFNGQYDPVKIFRLFIVLHYIYGSIELPGIYSPRQLSTGRIYTESRFVANLNTTIPENSPLTRARFLAKDKSSAVANAVLARVLSFPAPTNPQHLKSEHIKIINSLHWFFEVLNTEDVNAKTIHLVSAFDSLFGFLDDNPDTPPTRRDIVGVVADSIAENIHEKEAVSDTLTKLYKARNKIIHGRDEIHFYRNADTRVNAEAQARIYSAISFYLPYVKRRISQYIKGI